MQVVKVAEAEAWADAQADEEDLTWDDELKQAGAFTTGTSHGSGAGAGSGSTTTGAGAEAGWCLHNWHVTRFRCWGRERVNYDWCRCWERVFDERCWGREWVYNRCWGRERVNDRAWVDYRFRGWERF